ncbi:ubiquitin carboxyl-terminal hydrolase 12-like isoform X1 [Senna tora]|uniref:ubiquitinyl hydrolase 1 n=1 Tax=Senna tora TaxID=362788 RepID=A0A834T2X1_9FABA|nr:ubiquitin carboxyl-terminal hydrolase 12-like isoform X1 [Senna tora]
MKVAFHHATKDEVIHTIRLPKQSTVGDVLDDLKTKVELSHPNAELRLLEISYHKIYKVFPPNEKIENINDQYWTLRAEEIPEEEKNLGPHDRLIHVYHFNKDTAQSQMERLKKEQEAKEEAHLYTIIKVARDEDLVQQIGKDMYFDLVDHDKVRSFRFPKQKPFNLFKHNFPFFAPISIPSDVQLRVKMLKHYCKWRNLEEEIAKEYGIPVHCQRFWLWAKRQNDTYRPSRPLTPMQIKQSYISFSRV